MKKRSKRKDNRVYSYSAVIILFAVCIVVSVILVLALFGTGDTKLKWNHITSEENQGVLGEGPADTEQSDPADTETGKPVTQEADGQETVSPDTDVQESEVLESTVQEMPPAEQVPETYEFTASDKSYFDDALFIGDSRTVGLREYGTLDNADYFASSGLNLYTIERTKVDLNEEEKITLDEMLQQNTYGKIYIMLGINELGYDFDTTLEKYQAFIDYLFSVQPDAILYVCANLHVNYLRDELDEIHNNEAINRMNQAIAAFADQKNIFYLDVNPLFDDEKGNLAEEYISDDTHVMGIYYETWCDWYCQNTIVK